MTTRQITRGTAGAALSAILTATLTWLPASHADDPVSTPGGTRAAATAKDSTRVQQPLNASIVLAGDGQQDAVDLGNGIFMSRDVSNAYRVLTAGGDVIINTGIAFHGEENFRRLSAVSYNPVAAIIFTQSHADHIGGWRWFNSPATETIAQANFEHVYGYWEALRPVMTGRSRRLWKRDIGETVEEFIKPRITTTFQEAHAFELGGRRFELYAVPGGETLDALIVWMPEERIVFTGNMMGPVFGHVPNLYTLRGDRIRNVQWYLDGVQRLIDLKPEVLITGHGEPIRGEENIRARLTKMRDAVQYIRDRTFEGMNAGTDLWTLMGEVRLPPELDIPQGHGKLPWLVRAIWEEHLGWFRYESTTELYNVPASAVAADVVELAGREPLLERARRYLDDGKPLQALHLAETVLSVDDRDPAALRVQLDATEMVLAQSGRENFSEVRWLESQISTIAEKIAGQ